MGTRGIISPKRSNPKKTPPAPFPGATSAPELTIQSEILSPSPNRLPTKSASQPSPSNKKGKAAGSGSCKDGSSHKRYSDYSPNHSPSPAKTRDHLLQNQLQHFSIHDEYDSDSNAPILTKIYKEIASHRQGKTPIKSYFKNLKALWDKAATSTYTNSPQFSSNNATVEKIELMERDKLMLFLLGLNDSYASLCSQFLLKPSQTVEGAYSAIIREERRRKSSTSK